MYWLNDGNQGKVALAEPTISTESRHDISGRWDLGVSIFDTEHQCMLGLSFRFMATNDLTDASTGGRTIGTVRILPRVAAQQSRTLLVAT